MTALWICLAGGALIFVFGWIMAIQAGQSDEAMDRQFTEYVQQRMMFLS